MQRCRRSHTLLLRALCLPILLPRAMTPRVCCVRPQDYESNLWLLRYGPRMFQICVEHYELHPFGDASETPSRCLRRTMQRAVSPEGQAWQLDPRVRLLRQEPPTLHKP